jgi:hypothetical protein
MDISKELLPMSIGYNVAVAAVRWVERPGKRIISSTCS